MTVSIIITQDADKGKATLIMNTIDYESKISEILYTTTFYEL